MSQWVIREATPEDFDAWRAVFAEVAAEGLWIGAEAAPPAERMRPIFESRVEDPERLVLVVDAAGVVGALHADSITRGLVELGMELLPAWRGRARAAR